MVNRSPCNGSFTVYSCSLYDTVVQESSCYKHLFLHLVNKHMSP